MRHCQHSQEVAFDQDKTLIKYCCLCLKHITLKTSDVFYEKYQLVYSRIFGSQGKQPNAINLIWCIMRI